MYVLEEVNECDTQLTHPPKHTIQKINGFVNVPHTIFLVEVVVDDGRYFSVWRQFAHHSPPIHINFVVLRLVNINCYYFSIVMVGENGLFAIVVDDGGVSEVKPRELAQPLEKFGLASNRVHCEVMLTTKLINENF